MTIHRGVATFTLDRGKCPPWLFRRMVNLGGATIEALVAEYGPAEFIKRIADPVWFQSLGTVLAFDWNASGLTTILTAALKEAIREREEELGVFICGGKGRASRRTPQEVRTWGERLALPESYAENLVSNSKMSAKVDSSLVQDGYQIYHHALFFSGDGVWAVVQQGMNTQWGRARRYHWFSESITDLIVEPHSGIISQAGQPNLPVLNLTAREGESGRVMSVEMVNTSYRTLMKDLLLLDKYATKNSRMAKVQNSQGEQLTLLELSPREFKTHPLLNEQFGRSPYLQKILGKLVDEKPGNYHSLLATEGVGPKRVRALALVGEVIYGAKNSYRDPARYSFAHGGKDGTPYPVDRRTYDQTIDILRKAINRSQLSITEKNKAVRRLMNQSPAASATEG